MGTSFKIIRNIQPELPIIIVTKPKFDNNVEENATRRKIIFETYKNAISRGDKNVYFVGGETLFGIKDRDACTVNGCHPNDLGFMQVAEHIYPIVKKALESKLA